MIYFLLAYYFLSQFLFTLRTGFSWACPLGHLGRAEINPVDFGDLAAPCPVGLADPGLVGPADPGLVDPADPGLVDPADLGLVGLGLGRLDLYHFYSLP